MKRIEGLMGGMKRNEGLMGGMKRNEEMQFRIERKEGLIIGISSGRKRKGRAAIAIEDEEERNSSLFSSRKELCVTTTVSFHRAPTYLK